LKEFVIAIIFENKLDKYWRPDTKIFINTAGSWTIGGPVSDAGLTGRKIVCDQYGGNCEVGGGAFSGKDGNSKTDRSGSYASRYIALNVLKAGKFDDVKVQLAYMIGVAEPSSIRIVTKKQGKEVVLDEETVSNLKQYFPLTPKQISDKFQLCRPIYYQTAKYGHFGIPEYPWEQLDVVEKIKNLF
jgi:S-adenosylmethionine synthetase